MRQWLFYKEMHSMVELDPQEIKNVYKLAGRKYQVQYFSVKDSATARKINTKLYENGQSFEDVYYELAGTDSIPQREIEYNAQEDDVIHSALFSDTVKLNQVMGPIFKEDNLYLVIKIKNWTDRVVITDREIQRRWSDVKERLTDKYAEQIWLKYAAEVMRGKRLVFTRDTFNEMARLFAPFYLGVQKETKNLFLNKVFDNETDDENQLKFKELGKGILDNRDKTFFQIDGQNWTVKDFEEELEVHPLVFRKRKINQAEFPAQFKLAIVDMVRDKYITDDAYRKGYQNEPVVTQAEHMWSDALISLYQENQYLESKVNPGENDVLQIITTHLNPYIDELQKKYNDQIEIDVEKFNKIELTHIDMFVTQKNAPFPIVVPGFPQITTDPRLNYGRRLE